MPSDQTKRAIWIDLDNSPHVPLFAPIIKHFREHGVSVLVTARDHAQTLICWTSMDCPEPTASSVPIMAERS
jgi:hypothetical protein